jgi:hypothetical protein
MKNKQTVFFGIAVIFVAVIFTLAGCEGDDSGGKSIPVKVRAYNNNGIAPAQSIALNTRAATDIMPLAADTGFTDYNTFYGNLGAKKANITPTKFILGVAPIMAYANNGEMMSIGDGIFDFAKNVTITVGEIPTDVTCAAMSVHIASGGVAITGGDAGYSSVEFEWPGGKTDFDTHNQASYYGLELPGMHGMPAFSPSWNGNKVTIALTTLEPFSVKQVFSIGGASFSHLTQIVYGAGERRMYNNEVVPTNSVIPGLNSLNGGVEIGGFGVSIVIPFTPITVSSNTSSVTFNISWDLTGIIEVYEGATASPNDDIYVLKKGWWEGLQMTASIQ